jgi:hypothetical protein
MPARGSRQHSKGGVGLALELQTLTCQAVELTAVEKRNQTSESIA